MTGTDNKQLLQDIFNALANGDDALFIDSMADEMKWIWMGSGGLSKTFEGKEEVVGSLWASVRKTLKPPFRVIAHHFIAEGEYVAVEAMGQNATPDGREYHNKYCWVCRLRNGKIIELKEYMDTELVSNTFSTPPLSIIGRKFLADFNMAKAILHFQRESILHFNITEKDGQPCEEKETVEITLSQIRPGIYHCSWKERNQNIISQVLDIENSIVDATWILPTGQSINRNGTLTLLEE